MMPAETATQIREVVLSRDSIRWQVQTSRCACHLAPTTACRHGEHEVCDFVKHPEPTYDYEADLLDSGGRAIALVWLADRVCRWLCCCRCHTAPNVSQPVLFDLVEG